MRGVPPLDPTQRPSLGSGCSSRGSRIRCVRQLRLRMATARAVAISNRRNGSMNRTRCLLSRSTGSRGFPIRTNRATCGRSVPPKTIIGTDGLSEQNR